jgi:hypothetical protein
MVGWAPVVAAAVGKIAIVGILKIEKEAPRTTGL